MLLASPETGENLSTRFLLVSVTALIAALVLTAATPPLRAHPLHPDLVVEDVQVAAAQPTRLRVKVANQGLVIAPQSQVRVYFHHPDQVLERIASVPQLDTGERQWLVIEAGSAMSGAVKITLVVDELGQVDEADEGNNVYVFD